MGNSGHWSVFLIGELHVALNGVQANTVSIKYICKIECSLGMYQIHAPLLAAGLLTGGLYACSKKQYIFI